MPHRKPKLPSTADSVRAQYEEHGAEKYYGEKGASYRNPHERTVRAAVRKAVEVWKLPLDSVLDLACGSGEVSLELMDLGCTNVAGADPYTFEAYRKRTGLEALRYSFEDIPNGVLEGRSYSLIVCSYALHLLEVSRLPEVTWTLAGIAPQLLIISPHKRPVLKEEWGWKREGKLLEERTHARLYRSLRSTNR